MKWLTNKRELILRDWKANRCSYAAAFAALAALGYSHEWIAKELAK